jgi:protein O-GlcNAc transferase
LIGVDALFAGALALEDAGRFDEALENYRRLLAQASGHADAWHNQGLLLARLGRLAEAEQSHRAYAQAHPQSVRARSDLADVLLALGRYEEALEALDHDLEPGARDGPGLVRRGLALSCLRRFDEARATFALARSRFPVEVARFTARVAPGAELDAMLSPENIFLERGYAALGHCDWSGWEALVAEARRAASATDVVLEPAIAFMARLLPLTGAERHDVARHIAVRIESRVAALPPPAPRQRARIRVGILSPDFREHLNAYLLLPLFELADRQRFELYAYSLMAEDGSAARARVHTASDVFRDLHAVSDEQAAAAIRGDDIDILLDVAGHTTGGRFGIVARRPARVQVEYLGFSASMASRRVDYAIVDRIVASQDAEWSETLVYLPHTWFLYDYRAPVPETKLTRADYGLPAEAFVYCAFHRAEKISPDLFELWMRILAQVPESVLWCLELSETAKGNLRREAAKRGIDPARLVFAPFEPRHGDRYLPRQRLGDLMLDSLYHNAMTTACDALGSGLPVLTLKGSALAARGGASFVTAAGLPELVVPDREAYVAEAIEIARDPKRLVKYREKLLSREGPLFDTTARVRELEACFVGMLGSSQP